MGGPEVAIVRGSLGANRKHGRYWGNKSLMRIMETMEVQKHE